MNSLIEFSHVLVFLVVAVIFTIVPIAISMLLAPRGIGKKALTIYECGIEPYSNARMRYSVHYYIYALTFIAFEVDILYMFPAALSYTRGGQIYEFYLLLVFVFLLALAIVYAWGKGVFTWKRKIPL